MRLFLNKTSPYARIARIALTEKGFSDIPTEVVDPWADTPQLLEVNSAGRIPTLVTDGGRPMTESLLIVLWLENQRPQPSLMGNDPTVTIARAGVAMGVIDAAVHTLIGRRITNDGFDDSMVGLRRRRTIVEGVKRLEADCPSYTGSVPDLGCIAAVVMIDYLRLRFANRGWMPELPTLDRLSKAANARASFDVSRPPPA